ncbi:hypothetical protein [Glaciibacter superstes]|uniref:hypothetical protein n=1 Tax=Glaciibacter superstes TaxID=501023 RepID=UPI0003B41F8E|nr:hypothetical protein [Glaciibacter superstes]
MRVEDIQEGEWRMAFRSPDLYNRELWRVTSFSASLFLFRTPRFGLGANRLPLP